MPEVNPFAPAGADRLRSPLGAKKYQLILLHTLVTIVLSYQLLFSETPLLSSGAVDLIVLGLLGTMVGAISLPAAVFKKRWLVPAVALFDTAATSSIIYLSGSASTNLYVTYFIIMLIAAIAPTLNQVVVISLLLCGAYAGVLYADLGDLTAVRRSHLLQVPILLILAVFYGISNESVRKLGRDRSTLIDHLSHRRRFERAIRNSEHKMRMVLEHSLDAFVMMSAEGLILEWNREAEALFGWPRAEVVGRPLSETIIPPPYRQAHDGGLRRFLRTGEGALLRKRIETQGLRRDGTVFPLELSVSPLRMDDHTVFTAFIRDISERKEAEEALKRSEDRYRRLVEVSPDAILLTRTNRIVFLNRAGMELFGAVSPEQVLGRDPADFFHPHADRATIGAVRRSLNEGLALPLTELPMLRLDGSPIHVNLVASALCDEEASPTVQLVLRNVTDQKNLEEQLRQSQKMEAVGQLAGGVAHDFNNMLLVIRGYTDLLDEDRTLAGEQREAIDQIRQASERAKALTSQLLAFSRRQVLQPKTINADAIVLNMESMLRTLAGEEVELCIMPDAGGGHVKADPSQIEQALLNLAVNARDAMPHGGRLTIATDQVELDDRAIKDSRLEAKPGPYVRVRVQDSGMGIDPEILPRIFEPFFTTKPKGKGTGLGLSTVYGIIKQSGGAIAVASEPGKGTEVALYLPRVDETATEAGEDSPIPATVSGHETVLVVEDEPSVRTFVCAALRRHGYTVLEARHGIEAVALVQAHVGRLHLVITDIVMPQISGREVAEAVVEIDPSIKILYMSGYTDDAMLRHGIVSDAVNFIQKPYTCEALLLMVRQVLDGKLVHA
jgi:two-component system, cell cycle sensor histidine kinase and response regulator CckA